MRLPFAQDALFALRVMRKAPLVTATIILCLGFSIGATATVVAWMEGIVLRPIRGVPEVERLASLKATTQTGMINLSYPAYQEIRREHSRPGQPFAQLAAFNLRRLKMATAADARRQAEPVWGMLVSANYFDVLRVRPLLGRTFRVGEDSTKGLEPVVVLSHALWQRRFASAKAVIGRRMWINDREFTIVGVAPPDFTGTISGLAFDLWMPVTMRAAIASDPEVFDDRNIAMVSVFARLPQNASLESARAAANAIGTRFAQTYAEDNERGLTARTLDMGPGERLEPLFAIMLAITGLVLLLVCTNVANLLLLRGAAREHEIAVRLAVGAQPGRIVRQLLTESLILAIAGVALGLGIASVGQGAFGAFIPEAPLPVVPNTSLSTRIVVILALSGAATVLIFGLVPALRTVRSATRVSLTGGTRGATSSGAGVREALVGAQFALSLAVLVAAGLFVRRLDELQQLDRGFRDPERVAVATVDFGLAGIQGDSSYREHADRLVEHVRAIPGVRSAAAATFVPLGLLGYASWPTQVDGYVPQRGESMTFLSNRVSDGYFETMGVPIVRGRAIDNRERDGELAAAVVNEAFAQRFWRGDDPIGRVITVGQRQLTVVGIAGNGKYEFLKPLDEPSPPFIYLPLAQWPASSVVLHIRADGDPMLLVPAIRRDITSVHPDLSVLSPLSLAKYTMVPMVPIRLGATVLTMLGGAALLLAALGLYAVIGYAVAQRRREIGVRMALGASPRVVVTTFLTEAGRYAGYGALAGLLLAFAVVQIIQGYAPYILPQVAGARAIAVLLALLALTTVAAFAAVIPAHRASRVDPTTALRAE